MIYNITYINPSTTKQIRKISQYSYINTVLTQSYDLLFRWDKTRQPLLKTLLLQLRPHYYLLLQKSLVHNRPTFDNNICNTPLQSLVVNSVIKHVVRLQHRSKILIDQSLGNSKNNINHTELFIQNFRK